MDRLRNCVLEAHHKDDFSLQDFLDWVLANNVAVGTHPNADTRAINASQSNSQVLLSLVRTFGSMDEFASATGKGLDVSLSRVDAAGSVVNIDRSEESILNRGTIGGSIQHAFSTATSC